MIHRITNYVISHSSLCTNTSIGVYPRASRWDRNCHPATFPYGNMKVNMRNCTSCAIMQTFNNKYSNSSLPKSNVAKDNEYKKPAVAYRALQNTSDKKYELNIQCTMKMLSGRNLLFKRFNATIKLAKSPANFCHSR